MDGEGAAPWWRGGIRVLDDGEAMAVIAIAPTVGKDEDPRGGAHGESVAWRGIGDE